MRFCGTSGRLAAFPGLIAAHLGGLIPSGRLADSAVALSCSVMIRGAWIAR